MPLPMPPDRSSRWWHDRRARPLALLGGLLVASGLVHLAVWAVLGGPWEGPVTWRKPILFGLSAGLTSVSLGWGWSHLPWRRSDGLLATLTAWALFIEVALIDLQRWRGVASHFNRATPFDSFVYDAMGGLILVVSLVAADLTIRLFRQSTDLDPATLTATRAGMVLLVVSCGLGMWASVHGDQQSSRGLPADLFGTAGAPKYPHGAAIHALQWLPLMAWGARRAGLSERWRQRLVNAAVTGSVLILAYAMTQTLLGRARFDATPHTAVLLVGGVTLLTGPCLVIAGAWVGRLGRAGQMRLSSTHRDLTCRDTEMKECPVLESNQEPSDEE